MENVKRNILNYNSTQKHMLGVEMIFEAPAVRLNKGGPDVARGPYIVLVWYSLTFVVKQTQ